MDTIGAHIIRYYFRLPNGINRLDSVIEKIMKELKDGGGHLKIEE